MHDEIRKAVAELCNSNPARLVPSQQALDVLVLKCQSADGVMVAQEFLKKLEDPNTQWTHKVKILSGIEAIHSAGLDAVTETIKQNESVLSTLITSPQCGAKARQVAQLLKTGQRVERGERASPVIDDLIDIGTAEPKSADNDLLEFGSTPAPVSDEQYSLI